MPLERMRLTSQGPLSRSIHLCRGIRSARSPFQRAGFRTSSCKLRLRLAFRVPERAGIGLVSQKSVIMAPPPLQKQYMSSGTTPKKAASVPRPSASVLLISPSNQILLLHRVQTSRSFPSAHVFPGGNLSPKQDGEIPGPDSPLRHRDGPAYRLGAIRECFEESGILLAKRKDGSGRLLEVDDKERERARKEIHAGRLRFPDWVASLGGAIDSDALIPFTRWVTPNNIPKRFTTLMYIYFLPISQSATTTAGLHLPTSSEALIPIPTSDGGVEHTAALFAPCSSWLAQARKNEIILFPPQYYLMSLLSPFLDSPTSGINPYASATSAAELQQRRDMVLEFLKGDGDGKGVVWAEKCMSPTGLFMRKGDGKSVLALDKPGPELNGSGRSGDAARVVLVKFSKEGPRDVEVRMRDEVLAEEKLAKEKDTGSKI